MIYMVETEEKRILEIVRKWNLQCISVGFEKILFIGVENEKSHFPSKTESHATIDWIECIE